MIEGERKHIWRCSSQQGWSACANGVSLERLERLFVYLLPRPLYLWMHNALVGVQMRVDGLLRMRWKTKKWKRRRGLLRWVSLCRRWDAAISRLVSGKGAQRGITMLTPPTPPPPRSTTPLFLPRILLIIKDTKRRWCQMRWKQAMPVFPLFPSFFPSAPLPPASLSSP